MGIACLNALFSASFQAFAATDFETSPPVLSMIVSRWPPNCSCAWYAFQDSLPNKTKSHNTPTLATSCCSTCTDFALNLRAFLWATFFAARLAPLILPLGHLIVALLSQVGDLVCHVVYTDRALSGQLLLSSVATKHTFDTFILVRELGAFPGELFRDELQRFLWWPTALLLTVVPVLVFLTELLKPLQMRIVVGCRAYSCPIRLFLLG